MIIIKFLIKNRKMSITVTQAGRVQGKILGTNAKRDWRLLLPKIWMLKFRICLTGKLARATKTRTNRVDSVHLMLA